MPSRSVACCHPPSVWLFGRGPGSASLFVWLFKRGPSSALPCGLCPLALWRADPFTTHPPSVSLFGREPGSTSPCGVCLSLWGCGDVCQVRLRSVPCVLLLCGVLPPSLCLWSREDVNLVCGVLSPFLSLWCTAPLSVSVVYCPPFCFWGCGDVCQVRLRCVTCALSLCGVLLPPPPPPPSMWLFGRGPGLTSPCGVCPVALWCAAAPPPHLLCCCLDVGLVRPRRMCGVYVPSHSAVTTPPSPPHSLRLFGRGFGSASFCVVCPFALWCAATPPPPPPPTPPSMLLFGRWLGSALLYGVCPLALLCAAATPPPSVWMFGRGPSSALL